MTGTNQASMTKKEKKIATRAADRAARKVERDSVKGQANVPGHTQLMKQNIVYRPPSNKKINYYLMGLMDPEHYELPYGIPDSYSPLTHVFRTKEVIDLSFSADGTFYVEVHPKWRDHIVQVLGNTITSRTYTINHYQKSLGYLVGSGYVAPGRYAQHYNDIALSVGEAIADYGLQVGTEYYIRASNSQLTCTKGCSFIASTTTGLASPYDRKFTFNTGSVAYAVAKIYYRAAPALNDTIEMRLYYSASAYRTATFTASGGETQATITTFMNAADTELYAISLVSGSNVAVIESMDFDINASFDDINTSLNTTDIPRVDQYEESFTGYRCVNMSALLTYTGDTTQNGKIAGALIDSLTSPVTSNIQSYSGLNTLLHAYNGSILTGAYGMWAPMHRDDVNFTIVQHPSEMQAPYLAFAGNTTSVAAENVRLMVYCTWEALTQDSSYNPTPSCVDEDLMSDAFSKLAHFPKVMCNPLHLSKILNFLRSGGQDVSKFVKKMGGYAGMLAPFASAINPGLAAGLTAASAATQAL